LVFRELRVKNPCLPASFSVSTPLSTWFTQVWGETFQPLRVAVPRTRPVRRDFSVMTHVLRGVIGCGCVESLTPVNRTTHPAS
jgi:hypothetical protein